MLPVILVPGLAWWTTANARKKTTPLVSLSLSLFCDSLLIRPPCLAALRPLPPSTLHSSQNTKSPSSHSLRALPASGYVFSPQRRSNHVRGDSRCKQHQPQHHHRHQQQHQRQQQQHASICPHCSCEKTQNLFFKRADGPFVYERWCKEDLGTYDPWGSRWNHRYSFSGAEVECYTRLRDTIETTLPEFDSVSCGGYNSGIKYVDNGRVKREYPCLCHVLRIRDFMAKGKR